METPSAKVRSSHTFVHPKARHWLGSIAVLGAGSFALNLSSCAQQTEEASLYAYGSGRAVDPNVGNGGNDAGEPADAETSTMSVATTTVTSTSGGVVFNCFETEIRCDGSCVDPMKDPDNCGACGQSCEAPDTCVDGLCGCTPPQEKCGTLCIDTTSDVSNCGACGNVCGAQEVCSAGACTSTCAESETQCGDSCVDIGTSVLNCGACDNACLADEECMAGSCVQTTTTTGGNTTGGNTTGGFTTGFVSGSTTGGGMPCTNVRPTGTEWDEATCDQWATETSECNNAWMVDNNYCNESCGRC